MPCYRFRFSEFELPLYYHGHVLPPPIARIVLEYAYQMTVWEDMCTLHDKLEDTLTFLHEFKVKMHTHLQPYRILGCTVSDTIRTASARLCHLATVNLRTAMSPRPRRRPSALYRRVYLPATPPQPSEATPGFVLPEMRNYV